MNYKFFFFFLTKLLFTYALLPQHNLSPYSKSQICSLKDNGSLFYSLSLLSLNPIDPGYIPNELYEHINAPHKWLDLSPPLNTKTPGSWFEDFQKLSPSPEIVILPNSPQFNKPIRLRKKNPNFHDLIYSAAAEQSCSNAVGRKKA